MKRSNIKDIPGGRNPGKSNRGHDHGPGLGNNSQNDSSDEKETFDSSVQQRGYCQNIQKDSNSSSTAVTSRAFIVSSSQFVRSLPREIELSQDEANDDSTSMEDTFNVGSYTSRRSRVSNNLDSCNRRNHRSRSEVTKQIFADIDGERGSCNSSISNVKRMPHRRVRFESYEVNKQILVDISGERGTYAGSLSKATGMPHGKGRLDYATGRWYEGDWKHGKRTGHGQLINGNGDLYEGELTNDHKHGKGTMRFMDGRVFVGKYINGNMIKGKMTYQDGVSYEGSWVDGMRHGRGKCVFKDASIYEGEFTEGEFHGHGKMSWKDGGWYEGEWKRGDMQGFGKEMRLDGSMRHEGQWSKGYPVRFKTQRAME